MVNRITIVVTRTLTRVEWIILLLFLFVCVFFVSVEVTTDASMRIAQWALSLNPGPVTVPTLNELQEYGTRLINLESNIAIGVGLALFLIDMSLSYMFIFKPRKVIKIRDVECPLVKELFEAVKELVEASNLRHPTQTVGTVYKIRIQ